MTTTSQAPSTDSATPVAPERGRLAPLPVGAVRLDAGMWAAAQEANRTGTLPHSLEWMERLGWIANFDRVREGRTDDERPGWNFSDSEIYKLLEALAWESARSADPWIEDTYRALVERVAAAQDPDGYLNTCYGHAGQQPRWSDLSEGHELYCIGHLLQAAVARHRTHGRDLLVDVACRAADLVCEVFGPHGQQAICGHPEIEVGLVELGRAVAEPRYVDQARLFVERRGHGLLGEGRFGPAYFQDDVPLRRATALRGHAVRALYLHAAAIDLAVHDGDDDLLASLVAQWDRTLERRTHLTGGMGSRHQDEGFGDDWELPPDRAYSETCAGIGAVMVAWRLLLATGDVAHADTIERVLHNVVATGVGHDGRSFFYANTLHRRTPGLAAPSDQVSPRAESSTRAPWFEVSCCPTNLARTMASLGSLVATTTASGVQIVLLSAGTIEARLPIGSVRLSVRTAYPQDGRVEVVVESAPARPVTLTVRIPGWAGSARVDTPAGTSRRPSGWAAFERVWSAGEVIRIDLRPEPELVAPDPRVDAVRGCRAVRRGPDVWCLEERSLPDGVALEDVVLRGLAGSDAQDLVALALRDRRSGLEFEAGLVPYRRWGSAGPTAMRVWLPTT